MTVFRRTRVLIALALVASTLVACGASSADDGDTPALASGSATASSSTGPADTGALSSLRIAGVFSGTVTDADFTQLGLLGLQAVEQDGVSVTYTESVAVSDAERVIRGYAADGNDVIWTHGSQFYDVTAKVAADNPDVRFIAEFDGRPENQPANVWVLDRQFHLGFYAIGVLAAELSRTGKIGYVGGLSLPFSYSEVHAMNQAITDLGLSTSVDAVWTGDFNDPAKAQRISTQLIDDGADVIVGSLNNGAVGMFTAADEASRKVWVTAKYTDKSGLDTGGNYAGAILYDFATPLQDVLTKIQGGENAGYYPLGFSTGVTISMPDDVPSGIRNAVTDTMNKVDDGSIDVFLDVSKIGN